MVVSPGVLIIVLLVSILTHIATVAPYYVQIAQVVSLIFSSDAGKIWMFSLSYPFLFITFSSYNLLH